MAGHHTSWRTEASGLWRTEASGVLAADDGRGFRLTVGAPASAGASVPFRVSRRDADGNEYLVGSGFRTDVRDAMRAAAETADRLARSLERAFHARSIPSRASAGLAEGDRESMSAP